MRVERTRSGPAGPLFCYVSRGEAEPNKWTSCKSDRWGAFEGDY
ncbi:hypothetical protein SAMN05428962_5841 [Paenibacillus sp. BC26]|nr:hypothetical protein SAMN05428962_5841 [Paenibacillus sp. BC26]